MKCKLLLRFYLLLLLGLIISQVAWAQDLEKGIVRVKLNPTKLTSFAKLKSTKNGIETGVVAFDKISSKVKAFNLKRVFPYSEKYEEKHKQYGLDLWYEVEYSENLDPNDVAKEYGKLSEISNAEIVRPVSFGEAKPVNIYSASQVSEMPFDDPRLNKQWHYNNDGSILETAVSGADINLFEAWKTQTGSPDVVVAIIDGGIDLTHPDLTDAVWVNETELDGENGVDDDGNGYVDDIYGYNFALDRSSVDAHFHGTHVAGTVGAINNNGIGVSGVAGGDGINPGTRLMSCQIMTESGTTGGMAEALIYAADNGAVIAQCSWGWTKSDFYEQVVLDAIDYFVKEAGSYAGSPMKGGLAVFAAGNEGVDEKLYPAAYESVIAVAAIDYSNKKASYSTYGDWVDVTAPGGYTGDATEGGVLSTYPGGQYSNLNGTSMACPHVSGIAALVVAEYGSSTFTVDLLKRHLITSVHDIEPFLTADVSGKMGSGFIDAALALQSGSVTKTPSAVNDLLVQTSQDEAKIEWSIVPDEDDKIGSSYTLYWSKNPFDAGTLSSAASTIINRYFSNVGDKVEYTLENLDSKTEYYFAVKAFDRWGNESDLSDVVKAATNNGPAINVLLDNSEIAIDESTQFTNTSIVQLNNNDEGLLKWSSYIGLTGTDLENYSEEVFQPVNADTYTGNGIKGQSLISYPNIEAPVSMSMDDRLTYNSQASYVYIGEDDVSLTNSSATRFYVNNAFNVTNFWVDLHLNPEFGPATVEFYKGSQITDAQLITSQKIESVGDYQSAYYVNMEEQLYLEAGNYYWVVFHTPAGNLYPLGLTKESEEFQSDNCLFSTNGGQNWMFVNDVYGDTNDWIWKLTLRSLNAHLGDYITLTPSEGELSGNSTQDLQLDVNAEKLIDGTYSENLVFASNDPENKIVKKSLQLNVDGHHPVLKSQSIVDYGNVFVGKSKTYEIEVANEGYAGYYLSKWEVSSSDPNFIVNKVSADYIPARDIATIQIIYKPTSAGSHSALIQMNNGAYSHSFKVTGVAGDPAKISLTPTTSHLGSGLTIGEPVDSISFDITNIGNYPLNYSIPAFSGDYVIEDLDRPVNNFGYTYNYAVEQGPDYTGEIPASHGWVDMSESTGVTNINDQLKGSDFAVQVDLGFTFPFYDRFYDKVWVNEQGVLIFEEDGNLRINNSFQTSLDRIRPFDMISAAMMDTKFESAQTAIYYQKSDGEFRVEYKYLTIGNRFVDLQIVLKASGDFDVLFYQVEKNQNELPDFFVGITDKVKGDHAYASNSDYQLRFAETTDYGHYFHFSHPGENMVVAAENAFGTLLPNETQTVTLAFNTESALQGDVFQRVPIISNDIDMPMSVFEVTANFTSGGSAELSMAKDTIDFGNVYKTSVQELPLQIINKGTAQDQITSIEFSNPIFSTTAELPYTVGARQSSYLPIILNTDAVATPEGKATITLASGKVLVAALSANVEENPIIEVSPVEGYNKSIDARTYTDVDVTITNSGLGDLEMAVIPNEWCYPLSENVSGGEISDYEYTYSKGNGAGWIDILDIAADSNLRDFFWSRTASGVYKTLELPKAFKFYGKEIDKIYVAATGWLCVEEPVEMSSIFDFPHDFPNEDMFHGVIAPMAGLHSNASLTTAKDAGIYYHAFDDKFVITYNKYVDMTSMSRPYDFQVVLYYNGRIDFNYRNFNTIKAYGIIGVESPDDKQGVIIHHDLFMGTYDPFSYTLFPVKTESISAQSSEVVKLRLDANSLYDGSYHYDVKIKNNSVDQPLVQLPIDLTVLGKPELVAENINDQVWYVADSVYVQKFKIKNTGTKAIELSGAITTASSDLKVEFYYPAGGSGPNIYKEGYVRLDQFVGDQILTTPFFGDPIVIADGKKMEPGVEWICYVTYSPAQPGSSTATTVINDINDQPVLTWTANLSSALPPVATVGSDVIVLADNANHTETRTLKVGNIEGASELEWTAELKFIRGRKVPETVYESVSTTSMNVLLSEPNSGTKDNTNASLKSTESYNRTLEHNSRTLVDNWLGFGFDKAFTSATKFTVPETGFTLSHIETWYRFENQLEGTLYVEILAGGSIDKASVVAKGSLAYKEDESGDIGKFFTIPLDNPTYLYPSEDFYVVIHYPLGVSNAQGIVNDYAEAEPDRYYYQYDGEWFDLYADPQFYDNAFMVKAHEEVFEEKTWVSINNLSGSITKGESFDISLDFNAANVQEYDNSAELTLHTNDPLNKQLSVNLYLLMNKGPQIELAQGLTVVEENDTSVLRYEIKDMEGDPYTVELANELEWAQITKNEDGVLEITLTPDYYAQGFHDLQLVGVDEHGEESSYVTTVEVVNVNREPIFTNGVLKDTIMVIEYGAQEVLFEEWIMDPDPDVVQYNIAVDNEDVLDLFIGDEGVILTPLTIGVVNVTISAVDEHGAKLSGTYTITVKNRTGIDDLQSGGLDIYPNPASELINIEWNKNLSGDTRINLLSIDGSIVQSVNIDVMGAGNYTFNVADLPNGIYIIEIVSGAENYSKKIIKQ
ncbi:S8 family serine peptidase [Carboxylicivirga linearis]|uniref:S8 family serine peptidase n=1 Tax=Carboxylicivirga linearis TaxID=1628157 RepID=A0ABS5JZQ7_9BACT|nr:S8 family serine peptidase [Carboxylicivirga linearis]MBS2100392.1 S8 family serine peptidase [Carboxylicivirga linearis]